MRRKTRWLGLGLGLVLGLAVTSLPRRTGADRVEDLMDEFFRPIGWLIAQLDRQYVEEVAHDRLLIGAYQGMLNELDPYSAYLPARQGTPATQPPAAPAFQVHFDPVARAIILQQPVLGTRASLEGLMGGDFITEIHDAATDKTTRAEDFENLYQVYDTLSGGSGSEVTVTVIEVDTKEKRKVTLAPEPAGLPSIRTPLVLAPEAGIGYMHIARFDGETTRELRHGIVGLRDGGIRGLILDLRFSPGGSLSVAREVSDLFLQGGVLVNVRGRRTAEEVYHAQPAAAWPELPLVLLVNRYTADAAEVVAAALRDNGRARLVGETTYGRGSIQATIRHLIADAEIRITTARYGRPDGTVIEGKGIEPDVAVEISHEDTRKVARRMAAAAVHPLAADEEQVEDALLKRAMEVMSEELTGQGSKDRQAAGALTG